MREDAPFYAEGFSTMVDPIVGNTEDDIRRTLRHAYEDCVLDLYREEGEDELPELLAAFVADRMTDMACGFGRADEQETSLDYLRIATGGVLNYQDVDHARSAIREISILWMPMNNIILQKMGTCLPFAFEARTDFLVSDKKAVSLYAAASASKRQSGRRVEQGWG